MDTALIVDYLYGLVLLSAGITIGVLLAYYVHLRETERLQEEVGELRILTEEYHGFAARVVSSPYWSVFRFQQWSNYPAIAAALSQSDEEG